MGVVIGLLLGVIVSWDKGFREGEASTMARARLDWYEDKLR